MYAMTGLSMGIAKALALQFPWANKNFVDVGGAQGCDRAGSFTFRRQQLRHARRCVNARSSRTLIVSLEGQSYLLTGAFSSISADSFLNWPSEHAVFKQSSH
jgi:hypothetical protein